MRDPGDSAPAVDLVIAQVGVSPKVVLGLNENHGRRILLRLRTDDLKGFRKVRVPLASHEIDWSFCHWRRLGRAELKCKRTSR